MQELRDGVELPGMAALAVEEAIMQAEGRAERVIAATREQAAAQVASATPWWLGGAWLAYSCI